MPRWELVALEHIGAVSPGADLGGIIVASASAMRLSVRDGDIFAVAQKIVSKAEDRFALLDDVRPTAEAIALAARCLKDPRYVELVLRESRSVLRAVPNVLIVEDRRGLVLANAGIDRSNVEVDQDGRERVLLLPEDPDASAAGVRVRIRELANVDVGVLINDSLGRAWRLGTIGTAIGVSGLPGLCNLRGQPDLHGRELQSTEVAMADELAAAASSLMGQGAEGTPIVLIRGVQQSRRDGNARELQRAQDKDLFR